MEQWTNKKRISQVAGRGKDFAGGCGLVRCSRWLCYSLATDYVGWPEESRETNSGKKVAQFTLKHSLQVFNKHTFVVTSVHIEVVEGSDETN